MVILKPTASTAAVLSVVTCEKTVAASMCIVGTTTAMRACVNILHLRIVNIALNINAVNLTATIADGPDLNTAHITNKLTRQGSYLCLVLV